MSHSRTSELTQPSRPIDTKTLRLLYIPASVFCIGLPLYLLFGFDPPRSGLVACLLPGLIGTVVGTYFGYRSLADVIEDGGDAWRVFWLGPLTPRSAFTDAGWRFRIYAGVAMVSGWLASGLLVAFSGY